MNVYYVYKYSHPITKLPFYIGKGRGNRCFHHIKETFKNTENRKKWCYLKGLQTKGLFPIIEKIQENLTELDAYELEKSLILKYGRKDIDENGLLLNLCIDNRPPPVVWTLERREIARRTQLGKVMSEKNRIALKNANKGKPKTEDAKKKMSESGIKRMADPRNNPMFGRKHSEETKAKIRARRLKNALNYKHDEFGRYYYKCNNPIITYGTIN